MTELILFLDGYFLNSQCKYGVLDMWYSNTTIEAFGGIVNSGFSSNEVDSPKVFVVVTFREL
ncbi:MAG: hypothetical protein M3Q95_03150 [Bacteroidota bacterium]|nr:hypothetical protein [Bacteroidota bacterium]